MKMRRFNSLMFIQLGFNLWLCRAGEEDSSRSADKELRRAGGVAGTSPLPRRGCITTGRHRIPTLLPGTQPAKLSPKLCAN